MSDSLSIGFLGAGKMACALGKGFVRAGLVSASNLLASDPYPAAREHFGSETGGRVTADNLEVVKHAAILIVAVKPAQVHQVLSGVAATISSSHLIVSIAAGVTLKSLESALPPQSRVVRVMPNTPALVGASATGYALGSHAGPQDDALVHRLFSTVGLAYPVKESLLDAVTGLSGSGPAYGYLMIEALSDGGVAAGLPRDIATQLAAQTLLGASRMVIETGLHPGALKDMVTSPGGTTIEGIHELEKGGVRASLMNAVRAASEKSRRLGQS